tara:strand:- start:3153 stop:4031 length:879 start_codon:yes stop_codon:yes gene_type:complete
MVAASPDTTWKARDVLERLGDASSSGRVRALAGDYAGRNDVMRRALDDILGATLARVDEDALRTLREGAAEADRASDDAERWTALRNAFDVAMRRLLATAGDADAALADVTYESAPDANETWEVRLNLTENDDVAKFRSLNDGVMGGMSDGFMARRTGNDGGSFMGNVSLERNGGFASVRAMVDENAGDFDGVYIEAKTSTPEKKFLFILKDEDCLREQINFKVNFKVGSEYARVKIPFAAFSRAERMGRVCLRNPLALTSLREIGLMILKGEPSQVGPFELCVREIGFYRG